MEECMDQEIASVSTKASLLKQQLLKFFFKDNDPENIMNSIVPILKSEHKISLRLLDFFTSIYSKTNNVYINNTLLYEQYRLELKSYSKKYFDPFNRTGQDSEQIVYKGQLISIAQLNFFRFLIENDLLVFIENNYDHIYQEMKNVNKERRNNRTFLPKNVKSPAYINSVPTKSCTKINSRIVVDFK